MKSVNHILRYQTMSFARAVRPPVVKQSAVTVEVKKPVI